jgi:beta-N-acetylhexosaminidase
MTLEQQVGKCFGVGFEGTSAPPYLLEWLAAGRVGGVVLFARNVDSPTQLATLTQTLRAAASAPLLISIDQEGGTVARLRGAFTEAPGALALSNTDDPQAAETAYGLLGQEMRELGINWNYAPVVDLTYNRENPTVGTRSFGRGAERVGRFARAAVRGLQRAGVAACAKHFPGLGNTTVDSHLALPTLDTPLDHMLQHDLEPYRQVIAEGVASVMTTHTRFTVLDPRHPATVSPLVVRRLLREELDYEGLVTTDCMEMRAIADHYTPGESAVLALLADVDIVLFSHTRAVQEAAMQAVIDAVKDGRLPLSRIESANARRAQLLERFPAADPDPSRIGLSERRQVMETIAARGVSLLKGSLPEIAFDERVALVEFTSALESAVMESGGHTALRYQLEALGMHPRYVALRPMGDDPRVAQAVEQAQQAQITIIATRNAHLLPDQVERARQIAAQAHTVVHLCLRNPYDAGLIDAETIIATCGDSQPQIAAALGVLRGELDAAHGLRVDVG